MSGICAKHRAQGNPGHEPGCEQCDATTDMLWDNFRLRQENDWLRVALDTALDRIQGHEEWVDLMRRVGKRP